MGQALGLGSLTSILWGAKQAGGKAAGSTARTVAGTKSLSVSLTVFSSCHAFGRVGSCGGVAVRHGQLSGCFLAARAKGQYLQKCRSMPCMFQGELV